jgi:hypothetical protein
MTVYGQSPPEGRGPGWGAPGDWKVVAAPPTPRERQT